MTRARSGGNVPLPTRSRFRQAMQSAVDSGQWQIIPAPTLIVQWPAAETHHNLQIKVLLSLTQWGPVLGIGRPPSLDRHDRTITYKRAFEILDDPESAL
jgi:hypothetical protein